MSGVLLREFLGLCWALALLAGLGLVAMRFLGLANLVPRWQWLPLGFWVGQAVMGLSWWVLGLFGLPVMALMMWGMPVLLFGVSGFLFFRKAAKLDAWSCALKPSFPKSWISASWKMLIFLVVAGVVFVHVGASMRGPLEGAGALGNWLYKVKLLEVSGGWPEDYFSWQGKNWHMAYPPGNVILLTWCAQWMGGVDQYSMRLVPLVLLGATLAMLASMLKPGLRGLTALAGMAFVLCNSTSLAAVRNFYAEPDLWHGFAVAAMVASASALRAAKDENRDDGEAYRWGMLFFLVFGGLAWTKQEGLVLGALMLAAFGLVAAALAWLAGIFGKKPLLAGTGLIGDGLDAGHGAVMAGSVQSDLDWHLSAFGRVMILPTLGLFLAWGKRGK